MNRIFRIIWSKALRAWVVASEFATPQGKGRSVDKRTAATAVSLDRIATEGWGLRLGVLMALLAMHAPVWAADRYWDSDGTGTGTGGSGVWTTAPGSLLWSNSPQPTLGPYFTWNNAALDNAIFQGTAGTVTLGVPITAHNLTFNVHNYTLTGGSLTLAGTTPTIGGAGNAIIESNILGTAGLTKTGGGSLTLTGNNTFSGGIFLDGGELYVDDNAALGASSNVITTGTGAGVTFSVSTGPVNRTVVIGSGGTITVAGTAGQALYTGSGNLTVAADHSLTNDANTYTGKTTFNACSGICNVSFSSVADLGVASALGAPTTVVNGTITFAPGGQYSDNISYIGDGDSSNRNWALGGSAGGRFFNSGTGTLILTGDMTMNGGGISFIPNTADMQLLGQIGGAAGASFSPSAGRTLTLGGNNSFAGGAGIGGAGVVVASVLANAGSNSSLGAGSSIGLGGTLNYIGGAATTDRTWTASGTLSHNGTGALALTGDVDATGAFTLGGSFAGTNTLSGVVSGVGGLRSNGAGTWVVSGANTFTGAVTVDAGTLRAGNASAFGASTAFTINGGTLDLNGNSKTLTSLTGSGGTLALGSGHLTFNNASGNSIFSGSISGSGGLTKLGLGTLTLKGANTYTGATTVNSGTLALDFTGAGGPTSNIISSASSLNLGGGTVTVTGAAGESNSQTFNGLNVLTGSNTLRGTSGASGSVSVNLGTIAYTGGVLNFALPTAGGFTTTNADGVLGGWATINGSDYAKVVGGNIVAFTSADYATKDNAATWLTGDVVTDTAGAANSPFTGIVDSNIQLGGLRYAANANSTVNVDADNTLAIGGTIIVAPSVVNRALQIQGGSITGGAGGGTLGIQQNGAGSTNLTIASNIVDNGGATSFVKSGTGLVTLTGNNTYTGATTISQGTLSVSDINMGGTASSIGDSSADASNLVLQGGTLSYTGTGDTTDRGFTLMRNGPVVDNTLQVTQSTANLRFDGEVVSPDGANLIKTGAGTLTLGNANNSYTGITTVAGGTLAVATLANGGGSSSIGASSSASSNLVLQGGGELEYLGGTVTTDRGFTVNPGGGRVDVAQAATTLEFTGTVAGTGTLAKYGPGTLLLSGTNTFSGGGWIDGGVLQAGSTQAFGSNGGWTIASGTTLDLNDFDNTVDVIAGAGTVDLGSATLTIDSASAVFPFNGNIIGTGGLTVAGGQQVINGCGGSYTGITNLSGGTLTTDCLRDSGQASGIGASSNVSGGLVLNNGRLTYTGGSIDINRGFTLAGGDGYINVSSATTTLGFGGQVTGGGRLRKEGGGTLVLSATNNFTGGIVHEGGTLRAASTSAFGTGYVQFNAAGTVLDLAGFNTTVASLRSNAAGWGTVQLGDATLTLTGGDVFSGVIEGTGRLVKSGGGNQTLSGCNSTYDGTTTISASTLSVACLSDGGAASSIGDSSAAAGNLTITGGGNLSYVGDGDSTNRQFTMGGHATLEASGTGAIEYTDTAAITMTGTTARTLTLTGTNTNDNILAAQISNPSASTATSLTKAGAGTWELTNETSSYTGATDIQGGVLEVTKLSNGGQASSIGSSTSIANNLVIRDLATLRYVGDGDSTDRLILAVYGNVFLESSGTGAVRFTNTGAWTMWGNAAHVITLGGTYAGDNLLASRLADVGVHKTSIAKNGPGTWIITGNNTHTGDTVINDGNLVIGDGGSSGNLGTGNVIVAAPTSTLSINRNDTFNFSSTISGQGALAQVGTGTTTLTSTGNSIGAARIDAGALQVNGALTTSTMAINGASTLTVNGTVEAVGGTTTAITGNAGGSTINVNGTLRASGDLGGGADTVNVNATLDTGVAGLNLGDGDDLLAVTDGMTIIGAGIGAGEGTDTVQVDNAAALTLDGASYAGFENLIKQNTGELTLAGNHSYSTGTDIQGGTLTVGDDSADVLDTAAVTMADGTTLNVNGTLHNAGGAAALTGSAGVNTINVATSSTLRANGDLGDGNDAVTLAGTLDTAASALGLGAGDDIVTLNDGAALLGTGIDAGAQTAGDMLVLNNALGLTFDGSRTAGFESLIKQNAGTATMTGTQTFTAGTTINGGALDVDGSLTTPTVTMADNTVLNIDGALQGTGGTAAVITGSAGINTVTIAGNAIASSGLGGLGAGNDVLDVSGTLNTGGGVFELGDGDDSFVVHDGTTVIGTIDGGAGLDSRVYDINTTATLGTLLNFEGVTKSGTGTLNINGPGATDLQDVQVLGGILNIGAGSSVVATAGSALNTIVGGGATLNVDGSYGCGALADTMIVSGTVSGTGTIDLCGGDDTLTLTESAVLNNAINGGGGTADTLVLDNVGAMSFNGANTIDFEVLQKENLGEATLTGIASYTSGTLLNGGTLTVDAGASLTTPTVSMMGGTTLNIDGTLQSTAGAATNITGGLGIETVNIAGTATAIGNLGGGNDVLDVIGTLDTGGGVFELGDGDDSFVVHDGTVVNGTIDGGAGLDSRVYDINTTATLGTLLNFEGVTKAGTGTLNINGPVATNLQDVQVLGGTLNIGAGGSVVATMDSTLDTIVASGATLNVDGSFGCGAGADTMTVAGTVSGSGTIDLCGGADTLTLQDGATLAANIGGGDGIDTVALDNAGAMSFDSSNATDFEVLRKDNVGEATLTGTAGFSEGTLLNGGTLTVAGTLTTPTVTMADGTTLNVNDTLQASGGAAAEITGSAGVNTVTVAAGADLIASGDLGEGNDVFDMAGTLNTGVGAFMLGGGDDTFNVYDTTDTSNATVDGGLGNDLLDVNVSTGNTVPLGALLGFESLGKSGAGTLEIQGPSTFVDVNVNAGTLRVTDTGSVGATNTTILAGATLELANAGSYTGTSGADTFTVAGAIVSTGTATGMVDLGDGADTFTIQDGADLSGLATPVSGGAGIDAFVADITGSATLGGAISFETLTKTNTGTLIVAGPAMSTFSTVNVNGGTLDIGVAGSLTGVQNATVASGATLDIDGVFGFTAGADSFTVAGNVTGTSTIDMLDGDDTFVIQDGADLSGLQGPVDGGAGTDTFVADLAGTATLGGAINFETLNKTNTGTLIVAGPAASAFNAVNVIGGTLDVGAAGALNGVVTGSVANGAVLNVDGSYTGSAGDDTLTVAGAVTGTGVIDLGDGDDTLTLNDGADLSGFAGSLDGGAHSLGDMVALDNAGAMTISAGNVANFEFLQKNNVGEATLIGSMSFTSGTQLNGGTLTVAGDLTTPTVAMFDDTALNIGGTLQGIGGTAAALSGSAGVNTVTITGNALASGDLGAGNDILDVVGTLDIGGGVFALGDGDDDFVVHDGTTVIGTVDGGAGLDSRVYDINGTAEFGALLNFEGVTKRGTGTLNISGPGETDLQSVEVEGGTLNIGPAGSVVATAGSTLNTVIASGATLNVEGSFGCGAGNDTITVSGTISGSGTVDMCGGDDVLVLNDGAVLSTVINGSDPSASDTVVLNNANAMTYDAASTVNFEHLRKENVGEATLVGDATFNDDTTLVGGTLTVAGSLTTPIMVMGDGTTLNVDGTLQGTGGTAVAVTGSAGVNTMNVAGTALVSGDLGGGNDVLDVTGTLDTGSGVFALGAGDDTLMIHDGTNIIGTVAAGEGTDTFNTDIATTADLGAVQGFETLSKTGAGVLNVNGPMSSDFTTVDVLAGTLNVAAGGSVMAQNTRVASGATLQVAGLYSGTAGDDTFTSMGTVRGALAFGAGTDTARFIGGDVSGVTALDGGAGTDTLSFSGVTLNDSAMPAVTNWERMELLNESALTLNRAFDLGGGVLAIDGTSRLFANAGASIAGNVENAGLIDAGLNRLAIGGNYTSSNGTLRIDVSPGAGTAGGLNVSGDIVGMTNVVFVSDGTTAATGAAPIQVIASPNDNTGTAGGFVPVDSADGKVRLQGSLNPWTFEQEGDHNWYLSTDASTLLPEIAGYAVLPSLGTLLSQQSSDLVHQRLAGARNSDPHCEGERQSGRAGAEVIGDCSGVWVAATASELELGANPGFAVTGDDVSMYVGIDGVLERDNRTMRAGGYLGYTHGVYWTSGVNSTDLPTTGPARIDIDTPVVGMYANTQWNKGHYLDLVLSGSRPNADVRTTDGFRQHVTGNTLTLSARVGHSFRLDGGWLLEPQLQLTASHIGWSDTVDAGGRELDIDDDLVGTARAALRVEKAFTTAGGATIKPWATLAIQNVVGEKENGMHLAQAGTADPGQAFPNHDLGTSASLDVGVEATLGHRVSLFGVLSVAQEQDGTDLEQRSANIGVRARW